MPRNGINASTQRSTSPVDLARTQLLRKPTGRLHPEAVSDYRPEYPLKIAKVNNRNRYGSLTDLSSYQEYAWAFLRRNRFYQRYFDGHAEDSALEQWCYMGRTGHSSFGLVEPKDYSESFADGARPKWIGIADFKPLTPPAKFGPRSRELELEYPESQVAFAFDLGHLHGPNSSLIQAQLSIARAFLIRLTLGASKRRPARLRREPSKAKLRAQLRVADLLSDPAAVVLASDIDDSSRLSGAGRKIRKGDLIHPNPRIGDLVDLDMVPAYDLHLESRKAWKVVKLSKETKQKRISSLATAAWRNIYDWGLLELLQFADEREYEALAQEWVDALAPSRKSQPPGPASSYRIP